MKFVFIDGKEYVNTELIEPLRQYGEVELYQGVPDSDEEAIRRGRDADVIIFGIMQISNYVLDRLPKLKLLQFSGTGVNTFVDVVRAAEKGVGVLNIEGYGNMAVAEFAIALMFSAARQIPKGDASMKSGAWTITGMKGIEIDGSTIGVVGAGNIGSIVAKKAAALGADVLVYGRTRAEELSGKHNVQYVSLDELFRRSDIISLHLKVNEGTAGIIDRRLIDLMKSGAFLINTARAELIDNDALYEALAAGRIAGAAIDVYEQEPPADLRMAKLDNVIATPHIAFYTGKATDNSVSLSVKSIIAALGRSQSDPL